jgi:hypothetical protein
MANAILVERPSPGFDDAVGLAEAKSTLFETART